MNTIHDDRYHKLIQKLILLRNLKGLTQVEIAARLNKTQSYISKVETHERRLDVIELIDWLHAIGCNLNDLLPEYLEAD